MIDQVQRINSEPEGVDPSRPVGYGNPPRAACFEPGQSGNPEGRPKGSRNVSSVLAEFLSMPAEALRLENTDLPPEATVLDALCARAVTLAYEGSHRHLSIVLERVEGKVMDRLSVDSGSAVKVYCNLDAERV